MKFQIQNNRFPWSNKHSIVPLSYCDFEGYFKNGVFSKDDRKNLLKISYSAYNPILFEQASKEVNRDDYLLNFLWINKQKPKTGHLIGENNENLNDKIIKPLLNWQKMQPDARMNLWYDGDFIPDGSTDKTIRILKEKGFPAYLDR